MGSKKKKGKKHLTEEEKLKQAEAKALAEKEKLVRRKRLTKAFLRLKKDKETELFKLNDAKLLDLWRPRLRKLKNDELLEEYKMVKAAFERNLRKKDDLIEDLGNSLDKNDAEYDNAFDMHLHNIDQLLEFYKKRLNEVREMYNLQKQKLTDVLNEEKQRNETYHDKSLRYLNGVINAVSMKYKELAADSKNEMFIRQEEIRNKANEETHALRVITDKKMKAVWSDIQAMLVDYDTKITPLRNEFRELRKKDDVVVAEIDSQFRKMFKLQVGLESLEEKDRSYSMALQRLVDDLMAKRIQLRAKYKEGQQKFDTVSKIGDHAIRNLALVSGGIIEGLDEMIVQRERLMRCIERCQRQERLDEKVDPFMKRWGLKELTENMSNLPEEGDDESAAPGVVNSSASVTDGLNFTPKKMEHFITCECNPCVCAIDLDDEKAAEAAGATGLKSFQEFALLEKFWTRFNRASLELRILTERKLAMYRDNQQLKCALRNYMGGVNPMQHNPETYSDELMVNPSPPFPLSPRSFLSSDSDYGSDTSIAKNQKDSSDLFKSKIQSFPHTLKPFSKKEPIQRVKGPAPSPRIVPVVDGASVVRQMERSKLGHYGD